MPTTTETTSQSKDQGQQDHGKSAWDESPSLPPVHRPAEKAKHETEPDKPKRALTNDEARKLATEGLEHLNQALGEGKSETLENYLSFLAKFPHYSFSNCMLIAQQCPDATHVAGYNKWKQLGRHVKKGEKAIRILAPLIGKDKATDSQDSDQTAERKPRGFRAVGVFDISQTEGKDLPQAAALEGAIEGDPGEAASRLEKLVASNGISLTYAEPDRGALGTSSGGKIVIRPGLSPADNFSVLLHELAHELLHKGERRNDTDRTVRETEAEAVAFTVCRALGIDSRTRSSDYIALHRGDSKVLSESLKYIQHTASYMIEQLMTDPNSHPQA